MRVFHGNGDGSLRGATTYPGFANCPVAGDFNGDGKPDVAYVGALKPTSIGVRLGDGKGGFGAANEFVVPLGVISRVAVADFDADGHPDLAAVIAENDMFGEALVFLGRGDGTFKPPSRRPIVDTPASESLAVADFNGDGRLDLFTFEEQNYLDVLLGHGDGTFDAPIQTDCGLDVEIGGPVSVGDVDYDGRMDLLFAYNTERVLLALGKGDGTFAPLATVLTARATTAALADADGDGHLDVLVGLGDDGTSTAVVVLFGDGRGGFAAPLSTPAFGPLGQLLVGDFDRNGRLDVVAANRGEVLVFGGQGRAALLTPTAFGGGNGAWNCATTADLDGDGRLDLVTGGATLGVLLNLTK